MAFSVCPVVPAQPAPEKLADIIEGGIGAVARQELREAVSSHLPRLRSQFAAIGDALTGPDPEAAVIYLLFLQDTISQALTQVSTILGG